MAKPPPLTNSLVGIGDLMLACVSPKSWNQQCSQRLMSGENQQNLNKMMVEGVAIVTVAMVYAEMCGLD